MPIVWSDAAISKLCCGILVTVEVKVDSKKLAEHMGAECTHRAVEFQVQKMKRAEKVSNLADNLATNLSKSGGKHKSTKDASIDSTNSDETPSKPAKKSRIKVKDDSDEGLEDEPDSTIRQQVCQKAKVKYVELDGSQGTSWKQREDHIADESQAGEENRPSQLDHESRAVTP